MSLKEGNTTGGVGRMDETNVGSMEMRCLNLDLREEGREGRDECLGEASWE